LKASNHHYRTENVIAVSSSKIIEEQDVEETMGDDNFIKTVFSPEIQTEKGPTKGIIT